MSQISVIVPVYKVEQYIHRCVDSILAQSFTDFQLILVDDGSPDNCPGICDEYAKKDERVVVIHQKNSGLSAARNAGIDWVFFNSVSEWITFIDSDDWAHPEMLQWLYDAAINNDVAISVCGYIETDGSEWTEGNDIVETMVASPEEFYVKHTVLATIACAKLYKKECFAKVRYPVDKIHEDEFLTYKVLFRHEKIAYTLTGFYRYYVNFQGITKSAWNPNRLSALDAKQEQICYFLENSFNRAATRAVTSYFVCAVRNIKQLRKYSEYKALEKEVIKEARATYKKYKKLIPFSENVWLYEMIKPKTTRIYWIYKGIIHKIKTVLGVNYADN